MDYERCYRRSCTSIYVIFLCLLIAILLAYGNYPLIYRRLKYEPTRCHPEHSRIFVRPYGDLPDAAEATAALADNATDETGWGDGLSFEVFVNLDYDPYLRGHGNETESLPDDAYAEYSDDGDTDDGDLDGGGPLPCVNCTDSSPLRNGTWVRTSYAVAGLSVEDFMEYCEETWGCVDPPYVPPTLEMRAVQVAVAHDCWHDPADFDYASLSIHYDGWTIFAFCMFPAILIFAVVLCGCIYRIVLDERARAGL